jgi:Tfp pilus assembly protein PilO
LIADELRQERLKILRVKDWPLSRKIRVIILAECFVSKAMQQFLQLAQKKIPEGQFF